MSEQLGSPESAPANPELQSPATGGEADLETPSQLADPGSVTDADAGPTIESPQEVEPAQGGSKATKPGKPGPSEEELAEQAERKKSLKRGLILAGVGLVVLALLYFLLPILVPRLWAQTLANQVNGSFGTGVLLGLIYGFAFTFIPVLIGAQALRNTVSWKAKGIFLTIALLLTIPNLMTLSIAIGTNASAHGAQRMMDVNAPGFRSASLWGAVIGAISAIALIIAVLMYKRRKQQRDALQTRVDELEGKKKPS